MASRIRAGVAVLMSVGLGVVLAAAIPQGPDDSGRDVNSVSGVSSGAAGSTDEQPDEQGIEQVPTEPAVVSANDREGVDATPESMSGTPQSQAVDIRGVQGTEGSELEQESVVAVIATPEGTIRQIRGIEGIDAVMLRNLEAVLRMQEPPPPPLGGGGGGRAAAALLTMENEQVEVEEVVDGREELLEFELDGS
jgi:hypothetical protein